MTYNKWEKASRKPENLTTVLKPYSLARSKAVRSICFRALVWRRRLHMQGNCLVCLECVISLIGLIGRPYQLQLGCTFRISRLACTDFLIANRLTPYPEALICSLLISIQKDLWPAYNGDARG